MAARRPSGTTPASDTAKNRRRRAIAAAERRRSGDTDHCVGCGSEDLFSGWFDADDYAVHNSVDDPTTDPAVRWTTFCNQCGTEQ